MPLSSPSLHSSVQNTTVRTSFSLATSTRSTAINPPFANTTFQTSYRTTSRPLSSSSSSANASSSTYLPPANSSLPLSTAIRTTPGISAPFTETKTRTSYPSSITFTKYVPTSVYTQSLTLTATYTTIFVLNPTSSSTIVGTETVTTYSTITSSGYDCKTTNLAPPTATKVTLSGISLSGFENGCDTDGSCDLSQVESPLSAGNNVTGQLLHFKNDDGFNTFRLPVSWQYLTDNDDYATATLDPTNFGKYDELVQACLNTGAYCVIDLHNYGRFNGDLIGQAGPSAELFAQLWGAIAKKYAGEPYVIFGLMNGVSANSDDDDYNDFGFGAPGAVNIATWAKTLQSAVNSIRNAGALLQVILLRGTDWTGTTGFVPATAEAIANITDVGGSKDLLVFDIHKFLDDGTGQSTECISSYITEDFAPYAQWLRCHGRQALLTEIGGGNTNSCLQYTCPVINFLNANADVFLGYLGWASGDPSVSSTLDLTPGYYNNAWVDQLLVEGCLKPKK